VGGVLPVRLALEGKAFAGAKIAYTDGLAKIADSQQPTVTTGKEGVANIPISRKGAFLLTTDIEIPSNNKELAEMDNLFASLSFGTLPR
jgi:hypothetical protein